MCPFIERAQKTECCSSYWSWFSHAAQQRRWAQTKTPTPTPAFSFCAVHCSPFVRNTTLSTIQFSGGRSCQRSFTAFFHIRDTNNGYLNHPYLKAILLCSACSTLTALIKKELQWQFLVWVRSGRLVGPWSTAGGGYWPFCWWRRSIV